MPPYTKAAREPIAYCGINTIGLKRRGFTQEQVNEIESIYKQYYFGGGVKSKLLEQIKEEHAASAIKDTIVAFLEGSSRGVIGKAAGMIKGNAGTGNNHDDLF